MSELSQKRFFSEKEPQKGRSPKEQKAKRRKELDLEQKQEFEVMKSELPILRLELASARQRIVELEEKLQLQDFER